MKSTRAIVALLMLALVAARTLAVSAAGLGLAPASMEVADALRGGTYERDVVIMNSDTQPADYTIAAAGDAGLWVSFYDSADTGTPLQQVTVPGEGRAYVVARFAIPGDTPDGRYEASIVVRTAPNAASNGQSQASSSVSLEARLAVTIEVTGTQILQGEVTGMIVEDTEIGYPISVSVHFRNTGNVLARPQVNVDVYSGHQLTKSYSHSETEIKPESADYVHARAGSEGLPVGEYLARVTVTLGGETLASEERPFSVLPQGTLTRSGVLDGLEVVGKPVVGGVTKIIAKFRNTGELETPARLAGEVYRDEALMSTIESLEQVVMPGTETTLAGYLEIAQPGEYTIRGQVNYGGKLTDLQELTFVVTADGQSPAVAQPSSTQGVGCLPQLGMGAMVLTGAVIMQVRRRRDGF